MSVEDCAMKNNATKNQTSADLYLFLMSGNHARTVRNEIQLLSVWNKKAVLAIVKRAAAMSDHNYATKFNATKIKLVPIYTFGL